MNRLGTNLSGIELKNPIIPASGTFGFGYEMTKFYDINVLGGISLKGTTKDARFGNPTPRIAECESGMINSVGLQNPGVLAVVNEQIPLLRRCYSGVVIANISGFGVDEYVYTAEQFNACKDVDILEINISCPNVHNGGMAFGTDAECAAQVVRAVKAHVKKPVYVKLSPNVTDIVKIALACEQAGADGLTLINTLLGMRIDNRTGKPVIANIMGGFSGPAIKPVALRMVYQVYSAVNIPIIGVGGISCADDVIEMMSAGASAVQIGAQNLVDPFVCRDIAEQLPQLLDKYNIKNITDIIGRAHK